MSVVTIIAGVGVGLPLRAVVIAAVLVAAAVTDLRGGLIPNRLTGPAALVFLALLALGLGPAPLAALGGAVAAALLLWGVRALGEVTVGAPGMGWGDVKLGAVVGLALGWPVLWALYLAAALGAVFGVAGRATGRLVPQQRVPFAPFIALGVALGAVVPFESVWERLVTP